MSLSLHAFPAYCKTLKISSIHFFGRISLQYWIRAHGQWADRLIRSRARSKVFPLICPQFPPKSMIPTKVHDYHQNPWLPPSSWFPPDQIVFCISYTERNCTGVGQSIYKEVSLPKFATKVQEKSVLGQILLKFPAFHFDFWQKCKNLNLSQTFPLFPILAFVRDTRILSVWVKN